ncbi:GT4 family glycosyltransferase PelF [Streptomyces sp. NPDC002994]|uniref:GT4 family glycosyltransferase PelF n=1 Tax=Streptomyces sp. NPDC002994 TaxID=3154441 RepID=UPI0033B8F884
MRIGLLTEGGYPYATGESRVWCDRLVRGLAQYEFDIYALSRSARQEAQGRLQLPPQVRRVRTAPLWAPADDGRTYGRRERRRFAGHFGELAGAICAPDEEGAGGRFAAGLYGLAELAGECGGLYAALRSEIAVRVLESACRAPGAGRAVHAAKVPDYLEFVDLLERALRPLSLDWYDGAEGLGAVDLCHAASGGSAALPGLLGKRFFGVPLLVTEYGVHLRAQYLAAGDTARSSPVRALLAAFHGKLAAEVYDRATLITPGNTHARRWQERCGADRAKLRTVYPGMDAERFAALGEGDDGGDPRTLVWVGRVEPAKDLISLLHAFAEVRKDEPQARLRIVHNQQPGQATEAAAYLAHCKALAAQLFPDEAADAHAVGENPVSFEEIGGPEVPDLTDAYAAGSVVVLSSVVEGFPISLVEAMFCGRATVSTDVGAVVEVIGGTGLVVPPRNPRALADACVALMRDPQRRDRLGAAARARALELFTVEQNLAAFRGIYLELISHCPVRREPVGLDGEPLLFANPAETHVPGRWAGGGSGSGPSGPSWAGTAAADPSQTPSQTVGAGAGLGERHA